MMKLIEKYIVSIERIMLALYLVILLTALLGAIEIWLDITFIGVIAVFWLPLFMSALMPAFYSAVFFYLILFAIPLLGFYFSGKKNVHLHISLLITLLFTLALHLHFVYELWKT